MLDSVGGIDNVGVIKLRWNKGLGTDFQFPTLEEGGKEQCGCPIRDQTSVTCHYSLSSSATKVTCTPSIFPKIALSLTYRVLSIFNKHYREYLKMCDINYKKRLCQNLI